MKSNDELLRGIDLNLLVVLDVLLRERSVSRAAAELGRSQPALSHALARLREDLGDELLVRRGPVMVPTPRGEALGEALRRILDELGQVLADRGTFDPASTRRHFVMTCPDVMGPLVPALLARLREAPGLDLEIIDDFRLPTDLAFGPVSEANPGMVAKPIGSLHQRVALRREHPALALPWNSKNWLSWPHIQVRTGGPSPSPVETALLEQGLSRRIGLVAPSFAMALEVVQRTDLLFTAPWEVLFMYEGRFAVVDPPIPLPEIPIAAMWPERLGTDPGHRWFRERAIGVLQDAFLGRISLGLPGESRRG